jgi:hypothetical protein
MTKIIPAQIINCCRECPNLLYNSDYNIGYDSGYDCCKTDYRIADDKEISKYYLKLEEWELSQNTLFKMSEEEKPQNPLDKIDKGCPLDDYNDYF